MEITIPELSLVLLIGPSGCGKSTFARRHFRDSEVVSSDFFRGLICDNEANQHASRDAFEMVHLLVAKRLSWRRLTIVDATNLQSDARKPFLELVRRYHYLVSAIAFDLPEEVCQQHNTRRPRFVPPGVITHHSGLMRSALEALPREGVRHVRVLRSRDEVDSVVVRRVPMRFDRRDLHGPFDIIGDVHGCLDELLELLGRLGYVITHQPDERGLVCAVADPPPGRMAVFVGDLGDRGPDSMGVYRIVMHLVRSGRGLCVLGNHDNKLLRKMRGMSVTTTHGLALTLEQLDRETPAFRDEVRDFLESRPDHYLFDGGRLVVAHAGLREDLQGRASGKVRYFALFGDTTGQTDENGLPVRLDWAAEYKGRAMVAYGHTPVAEPRWVNNAINLDTGCVFGGQLTALRYPEREIVSIPARMRYCEPRREFLTEDASSGDAEGDGE